MRQRPRIKPHIEIVARPIRAFVDAINTFRQAAAFLKNNEHLVLLIDVLIFPAPATRELVFMAPAGIAHWIIAIIAARVSALLLVQFIAAVRTLKHFQLSLTPISLPCNDTQALNRCSELFHCTETYYSPTCLMSETTPGPLIWNRLSKAPAFWLKSCANCFALFTFEIRTFASS